METTGLTVTIIGMGVVFLILSLLAVLAWGLERMFRVRTPKKVDTGEAVIEACIAAALAYHTREKAPIHLERVDESVWMQKARVYE